MVIYPKVVVARLVQRDNRFIATCRLPGQEGLEKVHVKNTGRCKELLLPNCEVALSFQGSPTRKTDYDLIAVKKGNIWVNIDSQVPNQLAAEGLQSGEISLPGLVGTIVGVKREVTYGNSRFDIQVTTSSGETAVVEVKGMTLEANQVGAFPDAPSERALKHVSELLTLQEQGIQTYVLFVAQLPSVRLGTIHQARQPKLAALFSEAHAKGLQTLVYRCDVSPAEIVLREEVPFDLTYPFKEN